MLKYILDFIKNNPEEFFQAVKIHLQLSFLALLCAIIISIPLGIVIAKNKRLSSIIINISSVGRMVPSFVILALVMPYLGIGFKSALIALVLLACPPILINTYVGFEKIDPVIIEAAYGMGMETKRVFLNVEFPIALPVIMEGIKITSVEIIASATLASIIGGGGLGDFILTGLSIADVNMVFVGAIPVSIFAILASSIFDVIGKISETKLHSEK